MPLAYLLLGSNLGDRAATLSQARQQLGETAGALVAASGLYETAPWGLAEQPAFLNQAVALRTTLSPTELLAACLAAEQRAGRTRHVRWDARTLDVDILLFDDVVLDTPALQLPHPRLPERRFALAPLCEIAATVRHPLLHSTIADLLEICGDTLPVERVS
ncbi:2-amino-4-hydroxy-6-hydroxymethyldihydropteridine diphosphokinase [Hymenobacter sp. J193]|uniref:2-amino-4-hydroxy-6- hydroxymethyldihydropteridine diphosphokinase n=1 Tax=Hymenobacter sp. J193 TaxID=2898429 RepID=UPI0021515477|nr:2-amino-4-hydroxy-6-hydroxymethyldihydropteridine diphosphokinase [Hymenobacter sp. J193]MCR5889394.1 2-amino-4-hydroxy-6-hydroxymethyldihydropteridine diphosphokinase [Hymenobacter sp. J193]